MRVLQRSVVLLLLLGGFVVPSTAQDDLDNLVKGSGEDAEKLVGAYISPLMKTIALGMNQGWYNTAKAHKVAGIDVTVTVNAMAAPSEELFFNVANLNLTHLELDESSPVESGMAPTVFGPDLEPVFRFKDQPDETFFGAPGLDLEGNVPMGRMPVPIAHFGFGLPKGTDVKLRYTPDIKLGDDGTFKLFGIGVMHDIKQWIPGIKLLPFDLSGFVGYTKVNADYLLDADNNPDQKGIYSVSATTVQGIISKKFSVLTLYGAVGYNIARSNLALKGTFNLGDDEPGEEIMVTDPVDLSFAASGPRMTAGMRLKLAIITLHADYTMQKYNCLTVGVGLSIR